MFEKVLDYKLDNTEFFYLVVLNLIKNSFFYFKKGLSMLLHDVTC